MYRWNGVRGSVGKMMEKIRLARFFLHPYVSPPFCDKFDTIKDMRREIRSFVKAFPPRDLPLPRCQIFQLGVVTIHTWDRLEPLARHEYFWHRIHQYLSAVRAARFAINHIKSIRSNPEWRLATSIVLLLPGFARAGLEKESRARLSRNSRPTTCNKYPRIRRNIIEKNSPIARRNPMTICYVRSGKNCEYPKNIARKRS